MKRSNFYSILYVSITVILLFLISSSLNFLNAETVIPDRPSDDKLVFNLSEKYPSFLSESELNALNAKLSNFAQKSSNQIVVLITDSFSGMEVNNYATQLFNKWGIGLNDKDNGLLLLIKPTESEGGRQIYISVGYGLESVVPDLMAKRVIDEIISPSFKAANFYAGLDKATDILMKLSVGEFNQEVLVNQKSGNPFILVLLIPFLFIFFSEMFLSRTGASTDISRRGLTRRHNSYYLPFFMGSTLAYGSRSSGFGSSGEGFGGGFGGFGGGMSGGGGAGGSW